MKSFVVNECPVPTVSTMSPVAGSYVALVTSDVVSLSSETAGLPTNTSNTLEPNVRLTWNILGRSVCG